MTSELERLAASSAVAAAAASLAASAGLDAQAVGERAVDRAVRDRLVATGLGPSAWAARLRWDPAERAALIDAVVVPETRLFRDGSPFEALRAMAAARAATAGQGATLPRIRVLSAACSTGEEPYSVAIALLAGGLEPAAVEVVGLDVSAASIARATSGVLPRSALRGPVPEWAEPWLERRADGTVAVVPRVREVTSLAVANLLSPPAGGPWDAILCRNLLIYLVPAARARVTAWLGERSAPGAPLFVGHAEVSVLLDAGWRRAPAHGPYALEPIERGARAGAAITPSPASRSATPPHAAPPHPAPAVPIPAVPVPSVRPSAPPTPSLPPAAAPGPADPLAIAMALASSGDRASAVDHLVRVIDDDPANVEAHALLGVLHAAAGRHEAARAALRRALYLDPDHAESRAQMVLLDTRAGPDPRGAS